MTITGINLYHSNALIKFKNTLSGFTFKEVSSINF